MSGLETIAIVAALAGTAVTVGSQIYEGQQLKKAAGIEAAQLEALGRDEFAAAQRDALEARLEGRLLESRQRAVAAASGGGSDDPTIVKLMTETGERTDYAAKTATYGGIARRDNYYKQAASTRRGGQRSLIGGYLSAAGSLAGGLGRTAEIKMG